MCSLDFGEIACNKYPVLLLLLLLRRMTITLAIYNQERVTCIGNPSHLNRDYERHFNMVAKSLNRVEIQASQREVIESCNYTIQCSICT